MTQIIHWNLRGLKQSNTQNWRSKVAIISDLLNKPQNIILINLQETHLTDSLQIPSDWRKFDHLFHIISTFATHTDSFSGITVFLNKSFKICQVETILQGRILLIKAQNEVTSECVNFMSIYGRASGSADHKKEIFQKITQKMQTENLENSFLIGDYNFVTSTLDRNTDRLNYVDTICKNIWLNIETTLNICDSFRLTNPNRRLYTYSSHSDSKSRIDRIYIPLAWSNKIISNVFENVDVSDHKIVKSKFSLQVKKGRGHYIFNNSLLDDPVFVHHVKSIINDYKESYNLYGSYRILWDFLKMAISDFSKHYSVIKSRKKDKEYNEAIQIIRIIESMPKRELTNSLKLVLENKKN